MNEPTSRTYRISVRGGLLGLERTLGLLRRRRVSVLWLAIRQGESPNHASLLFRVSSANHDQVRRQLDRLIEVADQTDFEEDCRDHAA